MSSQNRQVRVVRPFPIQTRGAEEGDGAACYAEGYAARFNSPTMLFELDGTEYWEVIAPGAFDGADMEDVIFNYNHTGNVIARTRNGTLELTTDEEGLRMRARVDGTAAGRQLYEEILGGYVDRMSFAFTIQEESYDSVEHLWTIQKVKRLYDVSAVDIPAYDDTSIAARRAAVEDSQRARQAALALDKRKLKLKCKL